MSRWYAIRTRPRQEETARLNLGRQGFEVYLPCMTCTVRHARKAARVLRPVFPGYLFVRLSEEECRWSAINGTFGVLSAVHFGALYPEVPAEVVASLRALEGEGEAIDGALFAAQGLTPGCSVRVDLGGLEELRAVVTRVDGEHNVRVLLELLGRQVTTTVRADQLRRI